MIELADYIEINNKSVFIQESIPEISTGRGFVFLNPIFDEKNRVQNFQSNTARALCSIGLHVIRFDYYGTGDSEGEFYELSFENAVEDLKNITDYFKRKYDLSSICWLGIRMGADLALSNSSLDIQGIYVIEPVLKGKRYLSEQRLRRKAFHKLNNMDTDDQIIIEGQKYEDHQGYPMGKELIHFMENYSSDRYETRSGFLEVFKTDCIASSKLINDFLQFHADPKLTKLHKVKCGDFWATLENIDTTELTNEIINIVKNDVR